MGDVINLRRARKDKARVTAVKNAAVNRTQSGRTRAEREASGQSRALDDKRFEAHRREAASSDESAE